MTEDTPQFKIIFLGDQFVGKSSILNRFYQDKFEEDYQATIGLDFHSKSANINGSDVRLLLYDTAGQEKFKSLIPMYIRDANIILVVYDITNKDSFSHTSHWVNETNDLKRDDAIFCLVGNKIDLEDKRAVQSKEAEDFAKENNFLFHEVSAKTGEGVKTLFEEKIFNKMSQIFKLGDDEEGVEETNEQANDNGQGQKVKLGDGAKPKQGKKGCCGGGKGNKNLPAAAETPEFPSENRKNASAQEEQQKEENENEQQGESQPTPA